MILRRTTRTTRARLARVVAGKLPRMLHRGRVRNANRHPFTDGKIAIAHGLSALADTRFMLRALRQAGCDDTATPAYSIERERAIQVRADKRDPTRSVVHVKRNANGKLVTVDLAAGFCRDDGHDVPLAQRWTDKAGQRAMRAILEAGEHRSAMRDSIAAGMRAIDEAIGEHAALSPEQLALMGKHGTVDDMTRIAESKHAPRVSLHETRAQSAMIRAELDEARAMASLSGKAKRKLRDQLRAAKYAAR
jgi:hypothetical protein